jgi:hypothetical protein
MMAMNRPILRLPPKPAQPAQQPRAAPRTAAQTSMLIAKLRGLREVPMPKIEEPRE